MPESTTPPPLSTTDVETGEIIPHFNGIQEADIGVSITRKYGAVEVTLYKDVHVSVASMEDQHRIYDKLAQQLDWHHGKIATEHLSRGKPNGNPK